MFVFRVLFAFGFGHRFSRWSFVSVWEYFLSGSVRSCSEYVVCVLRRGGGGGPHCGLFCFFLLRIFADLFGEMVLGLGLRFFCFLSSSPKGVFYFLRIPFPLVVGLFFPSLLASKISPSNISHLPVFIDFHLEVNFFLAHSLSIFLHFPLCLISRHLYSGVCFLGSNLFLYVFPTLFAV